MVTQAQILKGLIMSKKLKESTSLLGIKKSTKDAKVKRHVFGNVANALKSFGKSRKGIHRIARRAIQTSIVSSSTKENHLTNFFEKTMGTLRKRLHKHTKFWFQIDANDELTCWT